MLGWLFLSACGGGGGNGAPPSGGVSEPAPTGLSYRSPQVLVVSQAMSPLSATVTGSASSYSVSPALPAGLSLNATTGTISGTPTAVAAAASYTITASNSGGSTTANLSITVNDGAPTISYGSSDFSFTSGVPVGVAAVNTGGAVVSWSIDRQLPEGLTFNTADGSIGGVPTVPGNEATYVVSAQNSGGTDTVEITIAVDSGTLLDLGHSTEIAATHYQGDRVLSIDTTGHWVLWNATTAASIAQGTVPCQGSDCEGYVDLAGTTVALKNSDGLQLRDASNGALVANVTSAHTWWKLASDGSYISTGSVSAISAFSRSGTLLFTRSGDYSLARAFAAPSELRVAVGASGPTTLEKLAVPSGSVTTAAFTGTFHSWFVDGARLLTNVGNTVWVFDTNGTQADLRALPGINGLGGRGNWFWIANGATVNIYSVGASATPAATFAFADIAELIPSGDTIGVLGTRGQVHVIDLSGPTPARVVYTVPQSTFGSYAAHSSTALVVGNAYGVLLDPATTPGTPKYFGLGTVHSIAANSERIAIATASGKILYFDGETRALEGSIDFISSKIRLSADGTLLVAMAGSLDPLHRPAGSLRFFSLPSGNVLRTETSSYPYPYLVDFELSESGQTFTRVIDRGASGVVYSREAATVSDGTAFYSDAAIFESRDHWVSLRPSPSGSMFTADSSAFIAYWDPSVKVYQSDGTLLGAVAGWSVGWIDDNRLLVHRYNTPFAQTYLNSVIAAPNGQVLSSLTLIDMKRFQTVSSDSIYATSANKILSLTNGAVLWETPNVSWGEGAVTGTHVIFGSGATVRAEPY